MLFLINFLIPHFYAYCQTINNCEFCENPNVCTRCYPGLFPDLDEKSASYGQCIPCKAYKCLECQDLEHCQTCDLGTYKDDGKCLPCQENCLDCTGPNQCKRCSDGYGKNGDLCVRCEDDNCAKCGLNYSWCIECKDYSGLAAINGKCTNCRIENCERCLPNNALVCQTCYDSYYVKAGQCVRCPDEHCLQCKKEEDGQNCTKCAEGYRVYKGRCKACPENCGNCDQQRCNDKDECDENYCDECKNGFFWDEKQEGGPRCMKAEVMNCQSFRYGNGSLCLNCYDGYGLTEDEKTCYKCNVPHCSVCDQDPNLCDICSSRYLLKGRECVLGCDVPHCAACNPYYPDQCLYCELGYGLNHTTFQCHQCQIPHCKDCDIGAHICLECEDGYKTNQDFGTECLPCQTFPECASCSRDINYCDTCKPGYYYFDDRGDVSCTKCADPNCYACIDHPYKCDECNDNYNFDLRVGSETFGQCARCLDPNCKSCNLTLGCRECLPGFTFRNGICTNVNLSNSNNKKLTGAQIIGVVFGVLCAVGIVAVVIIVIIILKKRRGGDSHSTDNEKQSKLFDSVA